MKEVVKGFSDSSGAQTAEKILVSGTSVYYTDHVNNGDPANADGNVQIGAKIDTASLTITVACALLLGASVGYGPYHNVLELLLLIAQRYFRQVYLTKYGLMGIILDVNLGSQLPEVFPAGK